MMKRIISFIGVFILLSGCAGTFTAPVHSAGIIVSGENRYKAVRLIPPVYNAANGDLSDLRVKDGDGEAVPFFIDSTINSDNGYYIESCTPEFRVDSMDRKTLISLTGLRNMRLVDITIDSDSMFKRSVNVSGDYIKELYRLNLDGETSSDLTIPVLRYKPNDETIVVTVSDGDDKPINITGVTARYLADEIVFEGNAGEAYMLEFGSDPDKKMPVYDIARYKNDILQGTVDRAALGDINFDNAETVSKEDEAARQQVYRYLFNILIIAVALLLGAVIVLGIVKNGAHKPKR